MFEAREDLRSGTYLGKIPKVFQRVMSRDLPMIF